MSDVLDRIQARYEANGLTFTASRDDAGVYFGQCPRHRDRKIRLDLDVGDDIVHVHAGGCGCLPYETVRQLDLGERAVPHVPRGIRAELTKRRLGVRTALLNGAPPGGDGYERFVNALDAAGLAGIRSDPGAIRGQGRYQCPACGALGDGHGLKVDRAEDGRALFVCYACRAEGREIIAALGLSWADVGVKLTSDRGAGDHADGKDAAEPTYGERLRAALLDAAGLDTLPEPAPLIRGILYVDSLAWLVGRPGHGKTLVALDVAGSVGTGLSWQGHPVRQGVVLYVIAEGARGIRPRVRAWEAAMGHKMTGVRFLPIAVQVAADGAWQALCDLAAGLDDLILVVVDTQARVTVGMEENSARDMGVLVDKLERLRRACGACVLVLHHTPRGGEHMRGSTAMEGATTPRTAASRRMRSLSSQSHCV